MRRCRILVPDAGPFNSLWVADALDLLLRLDMPIVVVDAVFDEMTGDRSYRKDREVGAFIEENTPPFEIVETDTGRAERARRARGEPPKRNAGEIAMTDFMTSEEGLDSWIAAGDPVLILSEDMKAMRRRFLPEPGVHALGTIGLLHGMERAGLIPSAAEIVDRMRIPSGPGRTLEDARQLAEPEGGLDRQTEGGSSWLPEP
ncbi:hypothetical protein [Jannaschia formosa]|uniref:hypothetical protein n=1 Tax=Jannaschia formosa TaxID=2259592 RepID=UPI000E1C2877|nr:hypothetical protein [Jannaschia formosa]TFL16623.1 hypothetical protein DR046_18755 [Jannaschia formosa]